MEFRGVHRKIDRTPEELARLKEVREKFQRERPSLDDLIASGEYDGPFRHGDVMALLVALATLKQERERRGLSLADVSERSGLDKGMLSRLENGKILNPTVSTLWRYAESLGMALTITAEKVASNVKA